MKKYILTMSLILSFPLYANEQNAAQKQVLNIDRSILHPENLAFANENNIKAKDSDFKLIHYIVMSNDVGERWAVLTLENTGSGSRMFESRDLMALFADGQRKSPKNFKFTLNFKAKERQTFTLSFGENKFPILSIDTHTKSN